ADDELHDAVVVEHREESGDKDDRGQDLKGEEETELAALFAQLTEHELRASEGVTEKFADRIARPRKEIAAERKAQDEEGENELQTESQYPRFDPDSPAIAGEQECQAEHRSQAENPRQTRHVHPQVVQFRNPAILRLGEVVGKPERRGP